jgi:hypothetical protein
MIQENEEFDVPVCRVCANEITEENDAGDGYCSACYAMLPDAYEGPVNQVYRVLVVTLNTGETQVMFSRDPQLMIGKMRTASNSTLDRIGHLVEDKKLIPTFAYWRQKESWKPLAQFSFRRNI